MTATHNTILPLAEQLIEAGKVNANARATMQGETYGVIVTHAGAETKTFYEGDETALREFVADLAD